jgi:hypothetical protein
MKHQKYCLLTKDHRELVGRRIGAKIGEFKHEMYALKSLVQKEFVFDLQRYVDANL